MAQAKKSNPVDNFLKKLARLPPLAHLVIASLATGYAAITHFSDGSIVEMIFSVLFGIIFGVLGICSILQQMKQTKFLEDHASVERLRSMNVNQFEYYVSSLFSIMGYEIKRAMEEIDLRNDADIIASKGKERILIQTSHWDEKDIGTSPLSMLRKTATAIGATRCIAITTWNFASDSIDSSPRRGIELLSGEELVLLTKKTLGISSADTSQISLPNNIEQNDNVLLNHRQYLFIELAPALEDFSRLWNLIAENQDWYYVFINPVAPRSLHAIQEEIGNISCEAAARVSSFMINNTDIYTQIAQYATQAGNPRWAILTWRPQAFPTDILEMISYNDEIGIDQIVEERIILRLTHQ